MAYFEYSADGSTWVSTLPQPSSLSGDLEDLDRDSYRSVVNGNIIRNVIGYKWSKISFSWNWLSETDASTLVNTLRNAKSIYIKTKSPLLSSGGIVTLRGYVSKMKFDLVKAKQGDGYTVSFDFVEGTR